MQNTEKDEILYVGFNQDQGCFACGTEKGFKIFNTIPYKDTFHREFDGGIGIVEMLFRCNILALVGGGKHPKYPLNKVMLWDDHQMKCIGELSFKSNVKAVKLRKDKVVVVLELRIYVYNFSDLKLIDAIDTIANPRGLCALSPAKDNTVLACPDKTKGNVRIHIYEKNITNIIKAHESTLAYISLSNDGNLLATASDKGTLIRIFNTYDGSLLQEVRRGADKAEIYSIAFDTLSQWIACTSDKGTVHIFALTLKGVDPKHQEKEQPIEQKEEPKTDDADAKNPKSMFSFMKKILPKYFDSEWSFAQFRVPDSKTICAFGQDNSLIVISTEGNYYLAELDVKNGGECKKKAEKNVFATDEQ